MRQTPEEMLKLLGSGRVARTSGAAFDLPLLRSGGGLGYCGRDDHGEAIGKDDSNEDGDEDGDEEGGQEDGG